MEIDQSLRFSRLRDFVPGWIGRIHTVSLSTSPDNVFNFLRDRTDFVSLSPYKNDADWDCFKTPISPETLETRSQSDKECCAFSGVTLAFQSAGRAKKNSLTEFNRV